jgi:hypothetical protein
MSLNLNVRSRRGRQDAGIALITTLLLLLLMSSLLVGFSLLLFTDMQLAGSSNDDVRAFYGAEAGMEQMTASLGNLFAQNYSPSIAQINAISSAPPANLAGIQYVKGDGSSGYSITPLSKDGNGNPAATIATVKSGPYLGMTAMATEYTLLVNARTTTGKEVTLRRTTQTVGIPLFQFGVFCDMDCSFFAGPNFDFGGRMHTNGNLWLASGSTLTMEDKVDAYKDVIRTNLPNGWPTSTNYTGTVSITVSPGSGNYRSLAMTEGSLTGTLGSGATPNWGSISLGSTNYAGNLTNGKGSGHPNSSTGAQKLNLGIVTIGNGSTQAIDVIRRPAAGESQNITAERYYAQASLRFLLSDDPGDIMNLPCIDTTVQPLDLSKLAQPVAAWPVAAPYSTLKANLGVNALPLAASGAALTAKPYNPADGYWLPNGYPIINGFIKIEEQLPPFNSPCGGWKDVTVEILSLGYVGRNINPQNPAGGLTAAQHAAPINALGFPLYPTPNGNNNSIPTTGIVPSQFPIAGSGILGVACGDPHPNAVIRLERVRDNPLEWTAANPCATGAITSASPAYDFWPNTLFDPREGTLRDNVPNAPFIAEPTLNGVMHYIELDVKNLTRWFGGAIGATGPNTKDPVNSPYNFVVYISDRRGNYAQNVTWPITTWPAISPMGHETGEYGWTDIVNQGNAATGCPDSVLGIGEDLDTSGLLFTYNANNVYVLDQGAVPFPSGAGNYGRYGIYTNANGLMGGVTPALVANPTCGTPGYSPNGIWPMVYATSANAVRENPPLFFRRAVKVVEAQDLSAVGICPDGVSCGLTIATENPVYVQGDFNGNLNNSQFNNAGVPASIAADAVTLLSDDWNDVNSFAGSDGNGIYGMSLRNPSHDAWYRMAVIAGKGLSFPQPAGTAQDFGTDGGVHNFLRYIENWGGQQLNYRGSIVSLYYNRQATGIYKCCNVVYSPPGRGYHFDTTFLNPTLLPPRTPLSRTVNTTGFTRLMLPGQYQ